MSVPVRAPLTHVPLSAADLPPLDLSRPPWPGSVEESGGVRLHVRRTPGPAEQTAVFVHGLGGSSTNWTDLAAQLAGYANGISVDLPGTGASEPTADHDFTPVAAADVLARFVRGLDVGPVHLFGNSMGGAVAMLLAAKHPDLVRTLTLISPAVPDLRPLPSRMSDRRLALAFVPVVGARARRELLALTPRERAIQLVQLCFAEVNAVPADRVEQAVRELTEREQLPWHGPALARSTIALLRSWLVPRSRSIWAIVPTITAPSLVVWGAQDKVVTVRKAPRTTRLLRRGRLLVLPRTGHVAQMERPVTVARAVLGMWESVATSRW